MAKVQRDWYLEKITQAERVEVDPAKELSKQLENQLDLYNKGAEDAKERIVKVIETAYKFGVAKRLNQEVAEDAIVHGSVSFQQARRFGLGHVADKVQCSGEDGFEF